MAETRASYLLVGNPRTGSSILARALSDSGCLGRPEEYFWRELEPRWAARFGMPTPADSNYGTYMQAALRHGTTPNGVFAAKVFWVHAEDLIRHTANIPELADLPGHQRFRHVFGDNLRAVLLQRNCLRAAISLWRAEQSGIWNLSPDQPAPPPPPEVDVWRVTQLHALMHAGDIAWPNLLTSIDVEYLTLTYHDITSRLGEAVQRVANFVGVDVPHDSQAAAPRSRRQADTATERFNDQWTQTTGGCTACQNDRNTT